MKRNLLFLCVLILVSTTKIFAQVNLTATAGTLNASYTNLKSAFDNINNGVHQGTISISIIGNITETATANLNGSTGTANYTSVNITTTGASTISGNIASAIIKLSGADNVTIDGNNQLTISNTNASTSATLIWVASTSWGDPAKNNVIRNCILTGASNTTTYAGISQASENNFKAQADAPNSDNTYSENIITKTYVGIALFGYTALEQGNQVIKNTIGDASADANKIGFRGIYLSNQDGVLADQNLVLGVKGSNSSNYNPLGGIVADGGITNGKISNNKISNVENTSTSGWEADGITLMSTSAATNLQVYNNFIWNIVGYGWDFSAIDNGHGIAIKDGGKYFIHYNSINLVNNQTRGISSGIYISYSTDGNNVITNNIFANQQTTNTRYAIYSAASASAYSTINYNDYYSLGTLGYLSGDITTFGAWQTATGQDANSGAFDPVYTSATNLHLFPSSPLNGMGSNIAGITTDIDGDTRNTPTDIGADEMTPSPCSSANGGTATASSIDFCASGTATLSATGYSYGLSIGYQWQEATNIAGPYTSLAGQTNPFNGSTGVINQTHYYRLKVTCGAATGYSDTVTITVNNPAVATTTPGSRCGYGPVTLAATAPGYTLNWYSAPAGGSPIGTGNSFVTPPIGATTNFYVAATTGSSEHVGPLISPATCGSLSNSTLSDWPLRFNTYGPVTIEEADIYVVAAGTIVVGLRLSGSTTNIDTRTISYSGGTFPRRETIPLGFVISAPGQYQLTNISGSVGRISPFNCSYPFTSTNGNFSIVGSAVFSNSSTTTAYYNSFFNLKVTAGCEGTRTLVPATVTAPPAFSVLSATPAAICAGNSSTLFVNSANPGYTYQWQPGNLGGQSQTVSPAQTGYYVVTATDASAGPYNGCVNKDSVLVTVNLTPNPITLSPNGFSTCTNVVQPITATGGEIPNKIILTENFNSPGPALPAGWLKTSLNGGTAPDNWTLHSSGYSGITSNDATQYIMSSSDDQGLGSTTLSTLISPAFSLVGCTAATLEFWHYYHDLGSLARVDYSIDGGSNWAPTPMVSYTSTQGSAANFTKATISFPPAALGQPNVKIRFYYSATWDWEWAVDNVKIYANYRPLQWSSTPPGLLYSNAGGTIPYAGENIGTVYFMSNTNGSFSVTASSDPGTGCTRSTTIPAIVLAGGASEYVTITYNDADSILCTGQTVSFTANPTSLGTNEYYNWYKNGVAVGFGGNGPGYKVYTTSGLVNGDKISVNYGLLLPCGGYSLWSVITMTVQGYPSISSITPSPATICATDPPASLTAVVSSVAPYTYQWYNSGGAIGGATANPYSTNIAGNYGLLVQTSGGCKDSSSVTLSPTSTYNIVSTAGPNGSISPLGTTTVNCGASQSYIITANIGYIISSIIEDGTPLTGPFTSPYTHTFTAVAAPHTISVTFGVTGCASSYSANAGPDNSICSNTSFPLPQSPVATHTGTSASWSSSGTGSFSNNNYGAGGNYIPSAADILAGGVYLILTTNTPASPCIASFDSMYLAINPAPSVSISGILGYCSGNTTTITANTTIPTGTLSYQWYNSVPALVGSGSSLSFGASGPSQPAGNYSVLVTGAPGGCTASQSFTIIAAASPTVSIAGSNLLCPGATNILNAIATAGSGSISGYQWYNPAIILGATGDQYLASTAGNYTVQVTNTYNCTTTSNPVFNLAMDNSPMHGLYTISPAPVSCTNFQSFDSAFSSLNRRGIDASVVFDVSPGLVETAPSNGLRLGSTTLNGSVGAFTILFHSAGGGPNPLIKAQNPGTLMGIVSISGVDNVSFDQIDLIDENANAATSVRWGYGLFKYSAGDGVQNNTISNCNIILNAANTVASSGNLLSGSTGIFVSSSILTSPWTSINSGSTSNSNNKFYGNTISNVNTGIYLVADPNATRADQNNDIGGSAASTGNTIFKVGAAGTTDPAGIRFINQYNFNIAYNTIRDTLNAAPLTSKLYGIMGTNLAGNPAANIERNDIVLLANTTGIVSGIEFGAISTSLTNLNIINNQVKIGNSNGTAGDVNGIKNDVQATNLLMNANRVYDCNVPSATGIFRGILSQGNAGSGTNNITNNVLENSIITTTNTSFFGLGQYSAFASVANINNNRISGNTFSSAATTLHLLNGNGSTTLIMNNNTVTNNILSATGADATTNMIGGSSNNTTSLTVTGNQIINNRVTNNIAATVVTFSGIGMLCKTPFANPALISNNTIRKLSIGGVSTGIHNLSGISPAVASGTLQSIYVENNQVDSLYSDAVNTVVSGINAYNSTSTAIMRKNKIHSLFPGTGANAKAVGIRVSPTYIDSIYNNFINLDLTKTFTPVAGYGSLGGTALSTDTSLIGVWYEGGTSHRLLYNTIRLNGTGTGNFGAVGILVSGGTMNAIKNNIVTNLATKQGTGSILAIKNSGTITASGANYNSWNASGQNLAAIQAFTGGDANSVNVNPVFVSDMDLHIDVNSATNTFLDGTGTAITYPVTDIDNDPRATPPDIGADEFDMLVATPYYYRSYATGTWNNANNWEYSPDGISNWNPAPSAPNAMNSVNINIQAGHTMTINTTVNFDQLQINGILEFATGGDMTIKNGTGDDITINAGGQLSVTNTTAFITVVHFETNTSMHVLGTGRISISPTTGAGGMNGFAIRTNDIWETGSIFEWNNTSSFGASGVTFFPSAALGTSPIFLISKTPGGGVGGTNPTTINGILKVDANITWNGAAPGTKTFRDGITGKATFVTVAGVGTLYLGDGGSPTSAILGGGGLIINTNGKPINIPANATVTVPKDSMVTMLSTSGNFAKADPAKFIVNGTADFSTVSMSNSINPGNEVTINGKLITAHLGGLKGGMVSTNPSTVNVNLGSTIEYNAPAGNQTITNTNVLQGSMPYDTLIISGGGIKTPGVASYVESLVRITGTPTVNASANNFGKTGANTTLFQMDGGRLILGSTGTQPNMNGLYTLTGGVVEFANNSVTAQTINNGGTHYYQNIEVSGSNVANSSGYTNLNDLGTFTIKNGGVFSINNYSINGPTGTQTFTMESGSLLNCGNEPGFNGPNAGSNYFSVNSNIENISLAANSTINYYRSNPPLTGTGAQDVTTTMPYQHIIFSGTGNKTPAAASILEVKGNITKDGSAVFVHNDGTVLLSGTALQKYTAITGPIIDMNNITNNNTVGFNVQSDLGIAGKFTLGSAAKISLRDTSDVILRSGAAKTANVAPIPTNVTITYAGTSPLKPDSGRFVVERYMYNAKKWRFLSVPTVTPQTIREAWMEGAANSASNPKPGYGTQLGSYYANWAARGFDFNTPGGHDMKYWSNDANQKYIPVPTPDSIINTNLGYMKYVRGDRSVIAGPASAVILRSRGELKRNIITIPFTATAANQFFSAGNPYASAVDMRNITRNNASAKFYVWDPKLGGSYGLGKFQLFTLSGGNYQVFPGGGSYGAANSVDNLMESGAAFYVQSAAAGAGSVVFDENTKSDGSREVFFTSGRLQRLVNILETTTANGIETVDGTAIEFDDTYSNEVNGDDAAKMNNTGENLYIRKPQNTLMYEYHRSVQETDTVFLGMKNMVPRNYRFNLQVENMDKPGLQAWLIDKFDNSQTEINLVSGSIYPFTVSSEAATSAEDRFMIVFKQAGVIPVKIVRIRAEHASGHTNRVLWEVENETGIAAYELQRSSNGTQFTVLETGIAPTHNAGGAASYIKTDPQPWDGDIYYRVKALGEDGRVEYSAIVKLASQKQAPAITVSPNPVKSKTLQMNFSNQPTGNYSIQLLAANGQLVYKDIITLGNGNASESIRLKSTVAQGSYTLQVTGPDGKGTSISLYLE